MQALHVNTCSRESVCSYVQTCDVVCSSVDEQRLCVDTVSVMRCHQVCTVCRDGPRGSHLDILRHTRVPGSRGADGQQLHPQCGLVGAGGPHL